MSSFYNITNSAFDNDTVSLYVGAVHSTYGNYSTFSGTTGLAIGATLSAAQFIGGVCVFSSGATGNSTLPTASALASAAPALATGEAIQCLMVNDSSTASAQLTFVTNTGLTLRDTPKIQQGARGYVIAQKTGAAAFDIY